MQYQEKHYPKNLSWIENTPEFQQAIKLSKNKGRWEHWFSTTLGHIVTKIMDMDITLTLPDGTQYKPFATVRELKEFLNISDDELAIQPNWSDLHYSLNRLYRDKIQPQEKAILNPQKEFVREFFEQNVWWMVSDWDTVDKLIEEIRKLATMEIPEITEYVCEDIIEWIVMNVIWMSNTLSDWENIDSVERNKFIVKLLDKQKFTDYFAELVVDHTWRIHWDNSFRKMKEVENKIRALYVVEHSLEKVVWGNSQSSFRNTRYL